MYDDIITEKKEEEEMRPAFIALCCLLMASGSASGGLATQNDWSGGGGVTGPVTDWENMFLTSSGIQYGSSLQLSSVTENLIAGNSTPRGAVPFDMDGDQDMDVIEKGTNYLAWWENTDGTGSVWTMHEMLTFTGNPCIAPGDIDGDGDVDIAYGMGDQVMWWEQTSAGWATHIVDNYFDDPTRLLCLDMDDDGFMDLVGASGGDMEDISWWKNLDGTGLLWEQCVLLQEPSYEATTVAASDLDGDGDMDIVGGSDWGEVNCWINIDGTGLSWTEYTIDDGPPGNVDVTLDDLDGDGDCDIAAVMASEEIRWYENMNGVGSTWQTHTIDQAFPDVQMTASGDFNADGWTDIVAVSESQGIHAWTGDGGSSWDEHIVSTFPEIAFDVSVSASCLNEDGFPDILASRLLPSDSSWIKWWDMGPLIGDGSLVSSILNVEEAADWQLIDWTSSGGPGTSVSFLVRASDDPQTMGEWSDTLFTPSSLEGIISQGCSFFQYMTILSSDSPGETPVLEDISVAWLPSQGVDESQGDDEPFSLCRSFPNPSESSTAVIFRLTDSGTVKLLVYGISGRLVHSSEGEWTAGTHSIVVKNLNTGVYIFRVSSGVTEFSGSFVVTE